jgi:serine/threonine protein phosphatase PrpC
MGIYREAALWGDEHTELGEIAVAALPPRAAVALSRGRFPKGYPHLDPNEDAVLAATNGSAWLLAVADGHNGFDAARAALTALQSTAPATLTRSATEPEPALRDALVMAGAAVTESLTDVAEDRSASATALSVAIISGDRLTAATLGDTTAVLIRDGRARRIGSSTGFLGPGADLSAARFDRADLHPGDTVVVASDGLFDFLGRSPDRALARLAARPGESPAGLARAAVEQACAGGAGDNIAVALLYSSPRMG